MLGMGGAYMPTVPTTPPVPTGGLDITERRGLVAICYSMWFNPVVKPGKPFAITTGDFPPGFGDKLTLRKMWGLQRSLAEREWSFLMPYGLVSMDGAEAEQVSVCVAHQHTYVSSPDAVTRRGGRTFREQWRVAFAAQPKVVVVTWWNEWVAQRFVDEPGRTRFVDNYTVEASRDIEPMKGGHGDLYYRWLKCYIEAYKAGMPMPEDLVLR